MVWIARRRRCVATTLFEERDELIARMPRRGLADDGSGARIQRRIQRERAMPVVLEAVSLGASWRQRQYGIEPIESLNSGLFIDTEHGRVMRRIEIEPDHVSRFRFEVGIRGPHVTLSSVGVQAGAARRSSG
jgi:hypothetical protein